jgi:hypothetical protein
VSTISERIEFAHERQLALDRVRAGALGMTVEKYRSEQAAAVKRWAALMHEIMEASGTSDPIECLPEIVVAIERSVKGAAIKAAAAAARTEVQKMLRKAMIP